MELQVLHKPSANKLICKLKSDKSNKISNDKICPVLYIFNTVKFLLFSKICNKIFDKPFENIGFSVFVAVFLEKKMGLSTRALKPETLIWIPNPDSVYSCVSSKHHDDSGHCTAGLDLTQCKTQHSA